MTTATTTPATTPATAAREPRAHVPLSERINFRMVLVGALLLVLLGYPIYRMLRLQLTGGITRHADFTEIDLKFLSDFPMDQVNATDNDIPKQWREMNGKPVMLVGEMVAGRSMVGLDSDFDLVWSIQKCCLTGEPQVQHFIKCKIPEGQMVEYHYGLVEVRGTLNVGVTKGENGRVSSVYRVNVDSVKPK